MEHILKQGETILWSGKPDLEAIAKTKHGRKRGWFGKLLVPGFIIGFIWVMRDTPIIVNTGPLIIWAWPVAGAFALWIAYKRLYADKKKLMDWAKSLSYAITNKRILIFTNNEIDREFSLTDVIHTSVSSRRNAPGFYDLVWEKRIVRSRSGSSGHARYVSPLEWEQSETGLKALPESGPAKQIFDQWIETQEQLAQIEDDRFIDARNQQIISSGESEGESETTDLVSYNSPKYGFSISFPGSWKINSRYRRLAFGKWGIEKEAVWSTPDAKPEWNVLRGSNSSHSAVEIQVQKVEAFNTLEKTVKAVTLASKLGAGEVIDTNPAVIINGIPGFYITKQLGNADAFLPAAVKQTLSYWQMRQYILHDGRYQYFIEARWPTDRPGQQEVCEAIVQTIQPCP